MRRRLTRLSWCGRSSNQEMICHFIWSQKLAALLDYWMEFVEKVGAIGVLQMMNRLTLMAWNCIECFSKFFLFLVLTNIRWIAKKKQPWNLVLISEYVEHGKTADLLNISMLACKHYLAQSTSAYRRAWQSSDSCRNLFFKNISKMYLFNWWGRKSFFSLAIITSPSYCHISFFCQSWR